MKVLIRPQYSTRWDRASQENQKIYKMPIRSAEITSTLQSLMFLENYDSKLK